MNYSYLQIAENFIKNGMTEDEQYYKFANWRLNKIPFSFNNPAYDKEERDLHRTGRRIRIIYKMDKIIFEYYTRYGNIKPSYRLKLFIRERTGKRKYIGYWLPALKALDQVGWTPAKHVEFTRAQAIKEEDQYFH